MYHWSLFELHGKFDKSFELAGGFEMLLRRWRVADAYFISGLIVTAMQIGKVSFDNKIVIKEIIRTCQKNQLRVIRHLLIWYVWTICYPFLKSVIGETYTRYLHIFGRRLLRIHSHQKEDYHEK